MIQRYTFQRNVALFHSLASFLFLKIHRFAYASLANARLLSQELHLLLLSVQCIRWDRRHREVVTLDVSDLVLRNSSNWHVVKSLLLLKHELLLLLSWCIRDGVIVSLWVFSTSSLNWIATSTSIINIEKLTQLLLPLLVLLAREDSLTWSVRRLLRNDLHIQSWLRVVGSKKWIDVYVIEVLLGVCLAVRSCHGLVAEHGHGVLRDSGGARVVVIDTLILLVHCQSFPRCIS